MNTCINPKLFRLTLEKMVIGVEEPILIKGIGEMIAKVDSGNGGFNVIHGEDFILQGNILNFKTADKDGNSKRVSKKIKDTINVNIGGGHIQERPVIELDVQFGTGEYKKVPFSVCDRSDNKHQVLISKDFVGKELEALIDVTKSNIANDNINADYVTEAGNFIDTLINGTNTLVNGPAKLAEWEKNSENIRKGMWGEGGSPNAPSQNQKAASEKLNQQYIPAIDNVEKIEEILKSDAALIRSYISKAPVNELVEEKLNCPTYAEAIHVGKLIDYTGSTNEEADLEYISRLKKIKKYYKKGIKKENEEVVSEAIQRLDRTDDIASFTNVQNDKELDTKELEKILDEFTKRNNSIFYLISFKKDANDNNLIYGEEIVGENLSSNIKNWANRIKSTQNWSYNTFLAVANDIGKKIKTESKGFFALVSGDPNARKVEFYSKEPALFGANINATIKISDEIIEKYLELQKVYDDLGGVGNLTEDGILKLSQQLKNNQAAAKATKIQNYADTYNILNQQYKNLGGQGELTQEGLNNLSQQQTR